jgi:hypothetical protein
MVRSTIAELTDQLLVVLADYLGKTPTDLKMELIAVGPSMPVDSLDLFDVLPDFWRVTGLKVRTSKLTRKVMNSVEAFIEYVAEHGVAK